MLRHAPFAKAWRYSPSLSTVHSPCVLSHQRQVWKNALRCEATQGISSSSVPLGQLNHRNCDSSVPTCLRRIHGRKLGSILPFIKGRMPPKPTGEKRTAFCPSPIQNSTPKNYSSLSLNYGNLSQAIPQFLGHFGSFTLECH